MANSVFLGLVHAFFYQTSDFTAAVIQSLLHWLFDKRKVLSVLEDRNYIIYFFTYPAILNDDLHIVGVDLISLTAICPRALLACEGQ